MTLPINISELLNGNTIEWERIELKKGWNPENILHSLCAYANDINNLNGGFIIIGVEEENGKAILPPHGLKPEQIDSIQKKLVEISNKISPPYFPIYQPFIIDSRCILVVKASGGDNRPYKAPVSLSEKRSEKAFYIKRGSTTLKVKDGSVDERNLLEQTARIPYDDRVNQTASIDDIELRLIQSFLKEVKSSLYEESSKISFSELCKQLQIVKGSDVLFPTNAGLLLFNERPHNIIKGAKIELVVHKEKIGKDYEEKIFTGTIVNQIRDSLSFIKANVIKEHISKVSRQAEAIRFFNYPYIAIEEALVNAVYHKSYERDNPVEIQILPDRIEILSFPGPLPPVDNTMLQKKRVFARDYRNRKIGDFLKELKLTEGRGTGIPIIYSELDKNGSPPPRFETDSDRNYFLCTIKIHPLSILSIKPGAKERAIDRDIDITHITSSLEQIDKHLRLHATTRWVKDQEQIRDAIDKTVLEVLKFCVKPKSREEIFKHIGLYNNSKNFSKHIKPIIEVEWLQPTIPDKPTSKNQKYVISDLVKSLFKNDNAAIRLNPVKSSGIASVGYDTYTKILAIEFHHGEIWHYFNVPLTLYSDFLESPSLSSFYMHNIKGKFESIKL